MSQGRISHSPIPNSHRPQVFHFWHFTKEDALIQFRGPLANVKELARLEKGLRVLLTTGAIKVTFLAVPTQVTVRF